MMLRMVDDRFLATVLDSLRDGYTSPAVQEAIHRLRDAPCAPPPSGSESSSALDGASMPRYLQDVLEQQRRQHQKWGQQDHDPFVYGAILVEEVGEFAQAALQTRYGGPHGGSDKMRNEAVQIAAVALDIVACIDRDVWPWGSAAIEDPEGADAVTP